MNRENNILHHMNSFLYRVAQVYYTTHKESVSGFTFVFPNRRAGLFFQRYLSGIAGAPLFSPEIITINDCFASASVWQPADRLSMLFRLYRIYKMQSGSEESFDTFVFWGEMLLADFNEVDKYRVDAQQLFTNVTELKEIDKQFHFLSEKQIEAIRMFWSAFVPVTEGKTQEEFIATWKILYPVYEQFRNELISENTATEGMICREVTDRLRANEKISAFSGKQFVFVGFNALNACEKSLMAELQKRGQADFYWDYDADELRDPDNRASRFYAENRHLFPSKYSFKPIAESIHEKEIELIGIPSAVGQAKQTYSLLNRLFPADAENDQWINTAVVLPDENLLMPLLHSLPSQIGKVNVTMGYPLKSTPVSGLIEHIFELQRRTRVSGDTISFYHQTVSNIVNHQYIAFLCPKEVKLIEQKMKENNLVYMEAADLQSTGLLSAIFTPQTDTRTFLPYLLNILIHLRKAWQSVADTDNQYQLESDFLYHYYTNINRINDIFVCNTSQVEMNPDTLMRLIRQLTAGITIPFVGEPLDGLQIMGVLETRGLDFENIIFTSFNEGIFPAKSQPNSFIPHNLRKGFDLPVTEHQDAITAYNFYRLIHRAKRIFFLYDSRTEGMQTGEVSRFMHQLHYHYGLQVKHRTVSFDIAFSKPIPIEIQKTPAVMEKLMSFCSDKENSRSLSASSINTYIDCPLQFYLTKVENIQESDEIQETIEANMFGTIFHAVMENLYAPYKGKLITSEDFDGLIAGLLKIDKEIAKAFSFHYFKKRNNTIVPLEGNHLLIANILRKYILQVLKVDKKQAPFRYIASEERCELRLPIKDGKILVNLKGFIDRVDEKEGRLRILDYKTGIGKREFKNLEEVFEHDKENRPKFVLQTLLYGLFYEKEADGKTIVPGIYYIRDTFKDDFGTSLINKEKKEEVANFPEYREEFLERLTTCLNEIFDPNIPFKQTKSDKICQYCSYIGICNK